MDKNQISLIVDECINKLKNLSIDDKRKVVSEYINIFLAKNILQETNVKNIVDTFLEENLVPIIDIKEIAKYYLSNFKTNCEDIVKYYCYFIEQDDDDFGCKENFYDFLKKEMFDKKTKLTIVEILMTFYNKSKNDRAKNIFLNEAEILQQKTILLSKPRQIDILLTLKCNLKCIMCCNGHNHQYELKDEVYNFLVENMKYLEKIIWKGGEVFLYDKFFSLLQLAAKYKVNQTIITNGLLLNDDLINFLSKNNISITISIDGVDKQLYEKIRVGGKFEQLIKVLESLRKNKEKNNRFSYNMLTVLMSENYDKISDFIDFAISYKFNSLRFVKCNVGADNTAIKFLLTKEHQLKIKEQLYSKLKDVSIDKDIFNINFDYNLIPIDSVDNDSQKKVCDNKKCDDSNDDKFNNKTSMNNVKDFQISKEYNLFCVYPWNRLCIDINNMTFNCNCYSINIPENVDYSNLWNIDELVKYREKIVSLREKSCKIFLENKN